MLPKTILNSIENHKDFIYDSVCWDRYLLKEDFQNFWEYKYAGSAARFLDESSKRAIHSKIEPMKKVAKD